MKKIFLVIISFIVFGELSVVYAQNGFVVWSKGGGCERELHYNPITEGNKVGTEKLIVEKGVGADIWPHISYDGQWIAWARATKAFDAKYGKCDYHQFQNFDIYIARIDYGLTLPAKDVKKVAHGYLPSWGDDAKTLNGPKTLYFTHYETQTIKKVTINPDGTFSEPVEHHKFSQKMGTNAHIQMSPDGKFLLYRPGGTVKCYSLDLKKDISKGLGGCHPCWGPRSKYFIRSKNGAFFNTGTTVKGLGGAGVGAYFQGISNDAYWDEGRLWVIGRIGGKTQNDAGSVQFTEVGISNDGKWQLGRGTEVGKGSACDIHMFPPDFDHTKSPTSINTVPGNINISKNRIAFTTQIKTASSGLQLAIYSMDQAGKTAELFDIQGKRVGFIKMSGSIKNIMPINNIVNGRYILKVSGDNVSSQRSIFITR